jgi:hypothetical protein
MRLTSRRRPSRAVPRRQPLRCVLSLEQLEDRTLPSTFYAATASDLIADINAANKAGGANTIVLTAPTNSPYVLSQVDNTMDGATGLPVISKKDILTIVGNGDTIERSTASGTPDFRLLDVAIGASLTLQNLTLQDGLEDGSGASAEGGAIYNQGTLVLSAVIVQNNLAQGSNGANGHNSGVNNSTGGAGADAAGGGIWSNASLTLENGSVIRNNQAIGGTGGRGGESINKPGATGGSGGNAFGGGVYVAGGTATLTGATVDSNTAQGGVGGQAGNGLYGAGGGAGGAAFGGALEVAGGTVTLTNATLQYNLAQGGLGGNGEVTPFTAGLAGNGGNAFGGALAVAAGSVTLTSDLVENNNATGGSAALLGTAFSSQLHIAAVGGSAFGGGLYVAGGKVTMCTDTVEFNAASGVSTNAFVAAGVGNGGGIYIVSGATVYLDPFTVAHTLNNSDSSGLNGSTANVDGTYTVKSC